MVICLAIGFVGSVSAGGRQPQTQSIEVLTSSEFDLNRFYHADSMPTDFVKSVYAPAQSYYELMTEWKEMHPDIELMFDEVYWEDMTSKLLVRVQGGNPPDVFVNGVGRRGTYNRGLSADLSGYTDDWADFGGSTLDSCRDGDYIFARPWMTDSRVFYYWRDLLDSVGADAPRTWDDVIEIGQKLTVDKDGDGDIDQWGFAVLGNETIHTSALILPWVWSQGGDVVDANGKIDFNTPEMQNVFQFLYDCMYTYKISPTSLLGGGEDEFSRMFTSKQVAMQYFGDWRWGMMMGEVGEDVVKNQIGYAHYPLPTADSVPATLSDFYVYSIYSGSEKKDLAWTFIDHMTSSHAQILGVTYQDDGLPTRTSVMDDPAVRTKSDFWRFSADYAVNYGHIPAVEDAAAFYDSLKIALQQVLRQEKGIEQALAEANARVNE